MSKQFLNVLLFNNLKLDQYINIIIVILKQLIMRVLKYIHVLTYLNFVELT